MTGLFDVTWNHEVNLSKIEAIRGYGEQPGSSPYRLKLEDEEIWRDLSAHAYDGIVSRPMQLIAANPPAELAFWDLDYEPQIWFEPVIAWALCFDGQVRPVTAGGVCGGNSPAGEHSYVRYPDGRISAVGRYVDVVSLPDTEALLRHLLERAKERREQARAHSASEVPEGDDRASES